MRHLATSQEFLEQSSMLLQAYPETTRITTKYSYPKPSKKTKKAESAPESGTQQGEAQNAGSQAPAAADPVATLTLKTFHPQSGICLKFRTDRAAEIGRLILGLGKLAAGEKIESLATTGATADVEMADAAEVEGDGEADKHPPSQVENQTQQQQQQSKGKGKSKKSGSKR